MNGPLFTDVDRKLIITVCIFFFLSGSTLKNARIVNVTISRVVTPTIVYTCSSNHVDDTVTTIYTSTSGSSIGVVELPLLFRDRQPTFVSCRMTLNITADSISPLLVVLALVSSKVTKTETQAN